MWKRERAGKLRKALRKWVLGDVGPSTPPPPEELEQLRLAFKARYHHFKLLLNANNRALEVMAEMEEMIRGNRPFGMTFVRSRCTRVSTSVFQIIRHLDALAPGKYTELYDRFRDIQKKINPFIHSSAPATRAAPLVVALEDVGAHAADLVGAKMANLGEVANRLGFRVPRGFVVTARGYQRFLAETGLQAEIDRRLQSADAERLDELYSLSADIQQLIIRSPLPSDLREAIEEQLKLLQNRTAGPVRLALRSSALGEDLPGVSFAGQYRSELNVSADNVLQAYKEVVAGKYGLTAMTYRLHRGIRDEDIAMCVGCLEMVDAVASGVLYTRNPLNLREDELVIHGVWGLPKPVVDGSAVSDLFVVSREPPHRVLRRDIADKSLRFVCDPDEGVCRLDVVGAERSEPCLHEDQAAALARLALRIEAHYGSPQDIEWALDPSGDFVVLQSRPLLPTGMPEEAIRRNASRRDAPVLLEGGSTASAGVATGTAFVVQRDVDALQFPPGGVLVTAQALPRWATLLGRAAAVVSEKGSVAGHLANVAREFGVPALFGVPDACRRLSTGRIVTVDADQRVVYDGRIEMPEISERPQRKLMEGSPVHRALEGAARWIVPLNLLDPDSPDFRPGNCRTFHDITRFCHEKAVFEMFRFGETHHFPERSSKQLVCDVPMQFWVINLDDGFKAETEGKFVSLENIDSIPMRALWEGMVAVPWHGPPPVDTRGFLSVLLEATTNPGLDPALHSPYAIRNYFMISRHFCSLQSRFGFHFSTVEALVSERDSENYVSFQFKGGAANLDRRIIRARLVAGLLEELGFHAEVKEDAAFARLEGHGPSFMVSRLRALGYLIIHTRQLDMVMTDGYSVERYRSQMLDHLRPLVGECLQVAAGDSG
ncbi:pyruvate, water dikinase [Desulfoglaeba alkanexedens ALDC]|uniref:Phosphoenolpyruvate synthase n=2 Tax=Desulfoglaeba alkanexedens TaxID=361111 RepID=A0A4P8L5W9_9BACT|nr:pyruvate, water dikinase [Desulfoglaeba alkanexedens ALDC]